MPIITLTTDLGIKDHYLGKVKGAIFCKCKDATIVDITHQIQPFNIIEGAFVLKNVYSHFPPGTIHIINIDGLPKKEDTKLIACKHQGYYFIGADNGIFYLIFDSQPAEIYNLMSGDKAIYDSSPLHSVMVDAACYIANGKDINKIGEKIKEIKPATILQPVIMEHAIKGTIIYIDHYENLILNISLYDFERVRKERSFTIYLRGGDVSTLRSSYHDVPEGDLVCFFNSSGYLEVAINKGKAASLLGLSISDTVQIEFE